MILSWSTMLLYFLSAPKYCYCLFNNLKLGTLCVCVAGGGVIAGIFKTTLPRQFPAFCCMVLALQTVSSLLWQRFFSLPFLSSLFIFFPLVSKGLQLVFLGCLGEKSTGGFLLPQSGYAPPSLSCSRREDYWNTASPFCDSLGFAVL